MKTNLREEIKRGKFIALDAYIQNIQNKEIWKINNKKTVTVTGKRLERVL